MNTMKVSSKAFRNGVMLVTPMLLYSCGSAKKDGSLPMRYNILIIEADDHTQQMLSAYDQRFVQTPNMDRIAEGGVRFDNSFVANSISGPSRACLLTGKHSHANGFTSNERSSFDGRQQTFPKLLQQAGYETAIIGKWHLHTLPTGFDYWEILPGQGDYYNPNFINMQNDTVRFEGYCTDIITNKSLDWLKGQRNPEKPFFLMIQHKACHRNWLPRIEDLGLYEDQIFALPETFSDTYAGRPAAGRAEMSILDHMDPSYDVKMVSDQYTSALARSYQWMIGRLDPERRAIYDAFYAPLSREYFSREMSDKERAEWHYQRYMRDYAKVLHAMDEGIGRIMDYLKENDLLENTLVIYTSDQGFYMGEHGWFDKRFMYEESFRTPLIMHLPKGLETRGAIEELVQNIDLGPTILDFTDVDVPSDMHGRSLLPLLKGAKELENREAIYYHFYEYPAEHMAMRHYGVRTDRYKLIHFYHDRDFWELYDLEKDPNELVNEYDNPEYARIKSELMAQLIGLQEEYGDTTALRLNTERLIQ